MRTSSGELSSLSVAAPSVTRQNRFKREPFREEADAVRTFRLLLNQPFLTVEPTGFSSPLAPSPLWLLLQGRECPRQRS
jgi:hypothetical protein